MQTQMLVEAWKTWEEKPTIEHTAKAMEMECLILAKELGCEVMELRIVLANAVRNGETRQGAIQTALKVFGQIP